MDIFKWLMNKTLFEKLAFSGHAISLSQSVINNIDNIFQARGLLDGDTLIQQSEQVLPFIVERSALSSVEAEGYKQGVRQLILRHEPRVKTVEVISLSNDGVKGRCRLKLGLMSGEIEQLFKF